MKWFTILLLYVLNVQGQENLAKIQKVYLLENDFWCADQEKLKTDKGYLYKVDIDVEHKNGFTTGFHYYSETCYTLKSTLLGYIVPRYWMIEEDILSFYRSSEVDIFLFKIRFFFTEEVIDSTCHFKGYEGKIQEYITYKLPEKMLENKSCIKLKCDITSAIRMKHIKKRFKGLVKMNLLKFNEYIKLLDEKNSLNKIEDDGDFKLYFLKNYSECLENLKKFIKDLCYLKLLNDDITSFSSEFYINGSTIKVSQFKEYFYEKFNERLTKSYDVEIDETWQPLLDTCCNYFINEIQNNYIFFPIGDKYDINFYIEELSNLICTLLGENKGPSVVSYPETNDYSWKIDYSLQHDLKKLQIIVMKDLCETEYVHRHFSGLLEKQVNTLDDYSDIEKIVCDCYNMFVYIVNLYHKFNKKDENSSVLYSYFPPIFKDNYNLKIIDGIKIDFNYSTDFEQIRGFDEKRKEIIMKKDIDYFIDDFNVLYCPSGVLRMKNIHEIEVISSDFKNNMKFKINDYLSLLD